MNNSNFYKFKLPIKENLFNELSNSVDFEEGNKGRKGNHLVKISTEGIPIVRTTTKYNKPAHNFSPIHDSIVEEIKSAANNDGETSFPPLSFNNALIEIYDYRYFKMGYHSDQCLDLDSNSYIALFSCYERPADLSKKTLRKLRVKCKTSHKEFEISLENNSVVLFSLETNTKFAHKIILDYHLNQKSLQSDNKWLGITFRKSKTLIQFKNDLPYLPNGDLLKLADENQQKAFYRLRGQENKSMDFVYPNIDYTISRSDIIMPRDN